MQVRLLYQEVCTELPMHHVQIDEGASMDEKKKSNWALPSDQQGRIPD